MKLVVKAFNIIYEDWGEDIEDFFLSCQVDIGLDNKSGTEIYSLDLVSPKRLEKLIVGGQIEVGKGYFILVDYNEKAICDRIEKLINNDTLLNDNVFENISQYFKSHD